MRVVTFPFPDLGVPERAILERLEDGPATLRELQALGPWRQHQAAGFCRNLGGTVRSDLIWDEGALATRYSITQLGLDVLQGRRESGV